MSCGPKPAVRLRSPLPGLAALFAAAASTMLLFTGPAFAEPVTGRLIEEHEDTFRPGPLVTNFAVQSPDGAVPLTGTQPDALVGQRVTVKDGVARPASAQRAVVLPPQGPQTVLAIILVTPDSPQPAVTADTVRAALFTAPDSSNAFYKQQSGGATSLVGRVRPDGDIAGPLAISTPMAGCNTSAMATAADAAAKAGGWQPDAYQHVMYFLPASSSCDFGGLGELPGRRSWINNNASTGVMSHELGHNMGAAHANALSCSANGVRVTLSSVCDSAEYGDPFDQMGGSQRLMSSWHRDQIGQLPQSNVLELRESQAVPMTSSDAIGASGTQLLLVPRKDAHKPVASWLAIESRTELAPFDDWTFPRTR